MKSRSIFLIILATAFGIIIGFRILSMVLGASFFSKTPNFTVVLKDLETGDPIPRAIVKATWHSEPIHLGMLLAFGGTTTTSYRNETFITDETGTVTIPLDKRFHLFTAFYGESIEIYHPLYLYDIVWVPVRYGTKIQPKTAMEDHARRRWNSDASLNIDLINLTNLIKTNSLIKLSGDNASEQRKERQAYLHEQRGVAKEYFLLLEKSQQKELIPNLDDWKNQCRSVFNHLTDLLYLPGEKRPSWQDIYEF